LSRGRPIGLRASVGQTQGSPCVKAPGLWRIAAAELSRCVCDVAVCISRPKAHTYPLPTKDGGVLRTVGDAHAYIMELPKKHALRAHWQHAGRLMLQQVSAAAFTRQVHLALFMDGKLDAGAFEHLSSARRWRRHAPFTNR
jgi:hypothetical protein